MDPELGTPMTRHDYPESLHRQNQPFYWLHGQRVIRNHLPIYRHVVPSGRSGWYYDGDDWHSQPNRYEPDYRGHWSPAHVEWCYGTYRSYRESDNTFKPYRGPREQCYSPYS
jgi:hypothetical protein